MGDLYRVRAVWSGFIGAPGVSTFYFVDNATCVDSLFQFFTAIKSHIPSIVHIQVESSGDTIDSVTGELTGAWVSDPVADIVCTGNSPHSAPSGLVVDWLTATVTHGHRLRGRTFIVPLSNEEYDPDGTINGGTIASVEGNAADLITAQSASFVIWSRGHGTDGTTGLVTSAHVPDLAAVLRSRRD